MKVARLGWIPRQLTPRSTGLLANLSGALAGAKIGLVALSTFDTDYILVREGDRTGAVAALEGAGHEVKR